MGVADPFDDRVCYLDLRLHLVRYINDTGNFANRPLEVIACSIARILLFRPEQKQLNAHALWPNAIAGFLFVPHRNWFIRWITGTSAQSNDSEYEFASDDEDEEDKEQEKKTIKERLQTIQEVSQSVQNTIGHLASLGERVKKFVRLRFFVHCVSRVHRYVHGAAHAIVFGVRLSGLTAIRFA